MLNDFESLNKRVCSNLFIYFFFFNFSVSDF